MPSPSASGNGSGTNLPPLLCIDPATVTSQSPVRRVYGASDLPFLEASQALYRVFLVINRLSDAVAGVPGGPAAVEVASPAVKSFTAVLESLEQWIDEIPLETAAQRFGNRAFRVWGARLDAQALSLHESVAPPIHPNVKEELLHHFVRSFGNWTRLDYGTGHELSFITYLSILLLTGLLRSPEDEATAVLVLYAKYLDVCRKLQRVYRLEPAGSKGAYGLDDYFHINWIFGAAQLRNHPTLRPSMIIDPAPLLALSTTHIFSSSLAYVLALKRGPFSHHSPLLYSIATSPTVAGFAKMESGLKKMWQGEVVGKWPVVQHWWLAGRGGVIPWVDKNDEELGESREKEQGGSGASTRTAAPWSVSAGDGAGLGTQAPWATKRI